MDMLEVLAQHLCLFSLRGRRVNELGLVMALPLVSCVILEISVNHSEL